MTKKLFFSLLFGLFFFQLLVAQIENDSLSLKLNLNFGTVPLELNKNYISNSNDTLKLTLFKFYISGIEIEYDDKSKFVEQNSYHLIDIENLNSLKIPIDKKNEKTISNIKFNIGVDSLQSVSGALAGDLDLQN